MKTLKSLRSEMVKRKQEDRNSPSGPIPNEVIMVLRKINQNLERLIKSDEDSLEESGDFPITPKRGKVYDRSKRTIFKQGKLTL